MRVLLAGPRLSVKGPIPRHAPHLVQALRERGLEVETVGWGRRLDGDGSSRRVFDRLGDVLHIRRRLRSESFDVLFVKTSQDWVALLRDLVLLEFTRAFTGKRVIQFHGSRSDRLAASGSWLLKMASRRLVRQVDAVLVLSNEEQHEWQEFAPLTRFFTVLNPFVAPAAETGDDDARSEQGDPRQTILYVGRLIPQKGIYDLLVAAGAMAGQRSCLFRVVGDGRHLDRFREQVHFLGLDGVVRVEGRLEGSALQAAYESADVFVLPSYSEGFPTVIAEAMYYGLPVVTTRIRGAADQLYEGVNALFVPPGRPDLLAAALVRLLDDEVVRMTLSAANVEKVRDFAPARVARTYIEILEHL